MKLKHLIAKKYKIALFLAITASLFSCAQIKPLTGGEKDIKPPQETKSTPPNGTANFKENNIIIEFDEYIKLTNISSQLIVSPLMETPPEISVKGKKLAIKLKSELTPNTTYSINFGNTISDITENNIFPNYKYVFSTGTFIDSLSYVGTVVNSFDLSKKEKIYVLLYDQLEDSVPLKELPRYVALTDKEGKFSITNIAEGSYKLFAINDINGNYLFDLPNEAIGFKNEIITLNASKADNIISLFEEENQKQYVVKAMHTTYGKIDIVLNNPTEALNIFPLKKDTTNVFKNWSVLESNKDGDSLTVWVKEDVIKNFENIALEIKDKNKTIDTVSFDLISKNELKNTFLNTTTNIKKSFNLNQNIFIAITRPFSKYNSKNILLYEDSALTTNSFFTDIGLRKFELTYEFKENTNYQLFIPPNTFEDIYGLKNDTVKVNFKTKKESDYGTINLSIKPNFKENYILQLYKKDKLVNESYLSNEQKKQYKYLLPGSYSLKLIVDRNEDKKWTTGNYLEGLQPEKVIFYEKEISIKANWDNDINWIVNE